MVVSRATCEIAAATQGDMMHATIERFAPSEMTSSWIEGVDRHLPARRSSDRVHTLFRIAHLSCEFDEGLCRVRNISDEGIMVTTRRDLDLGAVVSVRLSDWACLTGKVVSIDHGNLGIRFPEPIDCAKLLQSLATQQSSGRKGAPRLGINMIGLAVSETGLQVIRVLDISQHGMKLAHDGSLRPGLPVKLTLENGIERRGVVRWSENAMAGVRLLTSIPYERLQSASGL